MKHQLSRRRFLCQTGLSAAGLSFLGTLSGPMLLRGANASRKLNCVQVGCGIRAHTHLDWLVGESKDNIVALVDPDEKKLREVQKKLSGKGIPADKIRTFSDYRVMFDKMGKNIDAVFVATPNHHHAPVAARAIDRGIAVFCEKPLTHKIAEARLLREMAAKSKAPTQMGNQGHCEEGYRRLCEFVWAGVVGNITEVHTWDARANGGLNVRPPTKPVPGGLDWQSWIGPAPFRDYHDDLHPHEWHTWYDFGNGTIGNMGAHLLDGAFWSLKLEHPVSFEAEEMRDGGSERYPSGARLRFDFPARGELTPVKVFWYEGMTRDAGPAPAIGLRNAKPGFAMQPPLLKELQKQYPDEEFGNSGTIYIGEKGVLYTGTYGGKMHVLPMEKMQQIKQPPKTLPRPKNVMADFLDACRQGKREAAASFDYAARLTEFALLGNLATRAGEGRKVMWDGAAAKCTNMPELNDWVGMSYRQGWSVA